MWWGKTRTFASVLAAPAIFAVTTTGFACAQIAGISDGDETSSADAGGGGGDDRSDPNISISPTDMDFGEVPCGTESVAKLISIQNKGTAPAKYKLVIPDGTAFRIEGPLEGNVDGPGLVTLKIFAKTGSAGESSTDLIVSAGEAVQTIHPKARGTGATFELLPNIVNFGDVRMQSGGGPAVIEVKNSGTAAVSLTGFELSADFTVTHENPFTLAPGTTKTIAANLVPAAAASPVLHVDLKPTLSGSLCGAVPVLSLEGRRVNSNVTISSGDWGKQNCMPQPSAKDIVISNYSGTTLDYTASLVAGSAFTIQGSASGKINPGNETTPMTKAIKVQPKPFGTNVKVIQEDLTIEITGISAPDGGTRKVPLKVDVRGAIVTIAPQQILTFASNGTTTDTRTFTAQNTGNETIFLDWKLARTAGGDAWNHSSPSSLAPGETKTGSVAFKPPSPGNYEAKLTPSRYLDFLGLGAVSCTPLTPIALKGTSP